MGHDDKVAIAKMGGGAGLTVAYGLTLSDWVAVATIIYFILQIGLLLPKYIAVFFGKDKA